MNGSGDDDCGGLGTWKKALEMTKPKPPKPPKPNNVQSKQQNARSKQKNLFASNAPKE